MMPATRTEPHVFPAVPLNLTSAPPDAEVERVATLLKPLASPVRLRLLQYLTTPHYLEEIASFLGASRQAALKHLRQLVAIGVLERRVGTRGSMTVTEYCVNPQALVLIHEEFERLSTLRSAATLSAHAPTRAIDGRSAPAGEAGLAPGLHVVRGVGAGRFLPLRARDAVTVIGRDQRCDIVLEHDRYASHRHAELDWREGRCWLTDLRGTNGTQLNWAPLARGAEVPLTHGDLVGVGKTLLLFWDRGSLHR